MQMTGSHISENRSESWRWYLVFTKPRREDTAQENLERQGYRVYFPKTQQKVRFRGRWEDRVESLFPRYLFVQLNAALQSLGPIRSTSGVASVVHFGKEYVVVPDAIVKKLVSEADPETGLHRAKPKASLQLGVAVQIISGALAGVHGILESINADHRVALLLTLLGRETRVSVSCGDIAVSLVA